MSNTIYRDYFNSARQRGLEFSMTYEEVANIQAMPCTYCGASSPSGIDRVNRLTGYIPSNCVPACYRCNSRKGVYEQIMPLAEAIARTKAEAWKNTRPLYVEAEPIRRRPEPIVKTKPKSLTRGSLKGAFELALRTWLSSQNHE